MTALTRHLADAERDQLAASGCIVIDGVSRCLGVCERPEVIMEVPIPAHLSHTGERRLAVKPIDACIAPLVAELLASGIETAGSCCGHKTGPGSIGLADGREIPLFVDGETAAPEGWRILTEPCDTCGWVPGWLDNPAPVDQPMVPCPDCDRGRRVFALTATCPLHCIDGMAGYLPCPRCRGKGVVTLGRFTLPALLRCGGSNLDWDGVGMFYDIEHRWVYIQHSPHGGYRLTINPAPHPGQFVARPEAND